jgi:hypothetical protein
MGRRGSEDSPSGSYSDRERAVRRGLPMSTVTLGNRSAIRSVAYLVLIALSGMIVTAAAPPADASARDIENVVIWDEDFTGFEPSSYHTQRIGGRDEAAYWDSSGQYFVLTAAIEQRAGRIFFDQICLMDAWDAEFDFLIGGGTGADGMTFAFCRPDYFKSWWGSFLDFHGAQGYAIEFDTYYTAGDVIPDPTTSDHIALLKNSAANHMCHTPVDVLDDNQWHHVLVQFRCGDVRVWLDGELKMTCEIPDYEPFEGRFGFTASTGRFYNNYHVIDNIHMYRPQTVSRVWRVEPGGSGDAPTIQAALDSATGCDTVLVAAGTYYEHDIAMKNGVCLMSDSGPHSTVIHAQRLGAGIRCTNSWNPSTRIEGFTIKGATDCAIECRHSSLQIVNNVLTDNEGELGAAISCYGGTPVIEHNVCMWNSASKKGGAIRCSHGHPVIRHNQIEFNSAQFRGGGLHIAASIATVEHNVINDNSCDSLGGGIHIESRDSEHGCGSAYANLTGNIIARNRSESGGGISLGGGCAYVTIQRNRIEGNTATEDGGGVRSWCDLTLVRNELVSNSAGANGGGLWLGNGDASVESNLIAFNAAALGGGIYCDTSSATHDITHNTICLNTSAGGAGIHFNSACAYVTGNIIALSPAGMGVLCEGGAAPALSCNDIWRNEGGDNRCGLDFGGNFSENPLFCSVYDTNFTLGSGSPCLGGTACGFVGAYGQGCEDASPPSPITNLTIAPGDNENKLVWVNPVDSDFGGVLIRYSTDGFPDWPSEGKHVENGTSGLFYNEPASRDSFIHDGLTDGVTYYYSVFAFDEVPNYSDPVSDSATPCDEFPPEFTISVFQNPYITNHLDVYVIPSEGLVANSLQCSVDGEPVDLREIDPEGRTCRGDYDLCAEGSLSIEVCGTDLCSVTGCGTRSFSACKVSASSGGSAISVDGRCEITLPPHSIRGDAFVLILDSCGAVNPDEYVYQISPASLSLGIPATLAISYADTLSRPEQLRIARLGDGGLVLLDSYLDRQRHRVTASIDSLGSFRLMRGTEMVTPDNGHGGMADFRIHPVPSSGDIQISFSIYRAAHVRARIVSVDGKVLRELLDTTLNPGTHTVRWDGTDSSGKNAGSGVYFCIVDCASRQHTRKIIYLR